MPETTEYCPTCHGTVGEEYGCRCGKAQWKCKHCGAEASSKCPLQRTVFPLDQLATTLGNVMSVKIEEDTPEWMREDYREKRITLTYTRTFAEGEDSDDFNLEYMIQRLADIEPDRLKRALCHHYWEIQWGKCLLGCHKSENPEPSEGE